MTKNVKYSLTALVVIIILFFVNQRIQDKHNLKTGKIFLDDIDKISKIQISENSKNQKPHPPTKYIVICSPYPNGGSAPLRGGPLTRQKMLNDITRGRSAPPARPQKTQKTFFQNSMFFNVVFVRST